MDRETGEAPSVDELWSLVQEQRAELQVQRAQIDQQREQIAQLRAPRRVRLRGHAPKRAGAVALSLALVAVMGGVSYAAMPGGVQHPGANRIHPDASTSPAPAWFVRSTGGKWTASHILASDLPPIYQRTVIVSPVISSGAIDPVASGSALLTALSTIAIASPSPSPNNRYLLHIEPGTYDLGSTHMDMVQYVDIEGSGQGSTIITSSGSNGTTLVTSDNAELRSLTVTHVGMGTDYIGAAISDDMTTPSDNTPIRLMDVTANASGAGENRALDLSPGSATVTDSTFNASGETAKAIFVSAGSLSLNDSSATGRGGTDGPALGAGMEISSGGTVSIRNSTLHGLSGGKAYGVWNAGGTLNVDASSLSGEAYVLTNGTGYALENGGTAYLGGSRLTGLIHNSVSLQCAYDYDGHYYLLGTGCT